MEPTIGMITEQGDLGLGFDPLNESDSEAFERSKKEKDEEKESR